jgi:hypothetical protein
MMFKKIGRLAEGFASNVSTSRRGFLGRVGKAALGVAGALGAMAVTASAQSGGVVCCKYLCGSYKGHSEFSTCQAAGTTCPQMIGCKLRSSNRSDCSKC